MSAAVSRPKWASCTALSSLRAASATACAWLRSGAAGEVRGDVFVRDGDQPVDELGRQGGVAGETAQDVVDMVHGRILPGGRPDGPPFSSGPHTADGTRAAAAPGVPVPLHGRYGRRVVPSSLPVDHTPDCGDHAS